MLNGDDGHLPNKIFLNNKLSPDYPFHYLTEHFISLPIREKHFGFECSDRRLNLDQLVCRWELDRVQWRITRSHSIKQVA